MRVALTMRVVETADYAEPRDAISHDWIDWLTARGHHPVPVPNRLPAPESVLDALGVEALVLTGGNDMVASPAGADSVSPDRTRTENALLNAAVARRMPVLGVCRGLHLINMHYGGRVEPEIGARSVGHVASTHPVRLNGALGGAIGATSLNTNSFHNQAVLDDGVGDGLRIFAMSEPDRVVEGLCHDSLPVFAVQWHPERPGPNREFDDAMIPRFLEQGAFWL
jgi:putative glutamine amidotransferase